MLSLPVIIGATLVLVLIGTFVAWRQYAAAEVPVTAPRGSLITQAARRDLLQEDVNKAVFERPGAGLVSAVGVFDRSVIDGIVEGTGTGSADFGRWLGRLQNGFVRSYASTMVAGVVGVLILTLVVGRWLP